MEFKSRDESWILGAGKGEGGLVGLGKTHPDPGEPVGPALLKAPCACCTDILPTVTWGPLGPWTSSWPPCRSPSMAFPAHHIPTSEDHESPPFTESYIFAIGKALTRSWIQHFQSAFW